MCPESRIPELDRYLYLQCFTIVPVQVRGKPDLCAAQSEQLHANTNLGLHSKTEVPIRCLHTE